MIGGADRVINLHVGDTQRIKFYNGQGSAKCATLAGGVSASEESLLRAGLQNVRP